MFDYSKLRGRVAEKSMTQKSLANAIGITPTAMSNKLKDGQGFKAEHIKKMCQALDIADDKIGDYFFGQKV